MVFSWEMYESVMRSCEYVLPRMLLVCAVRFRVVIYNQICPRVVVFVERRTLIGSAKVASIA